MARSISSDYGARLVDNFECVFSVLLAILLAHWIGASHVSWAAFSGYMVMRGHFRESMVRESLRIVGTLAGAAIALAVIPLVEDSWLLSAIAISLIGGTSLYGAMTRQRSHAWWLYGLTFGMILMDKLQKPDIDLSDFVMTRVIEVIAGTAACLIVSSLSTMTLRRRWPATPFPVSTQSLWEPVALRHSIQCGAALGLLPVIVHFFNIKETS